MNRVSIRILPVFFFLLFYVSVSEDEQVKRSLVGFMDRLAAGNVQRDKSWGWNMTSDPCKDKWLGVSCDSQSKSVKKVVLERLNLTGVLDIGSACRASSLSVLSLNENNVVGSISEEMGYCRHLTHLYLSGNQISGYLPESLKQLGDLKRFDVSDNNLSGKVPDISGISGLITFLAQNNELSGEVPNLDFSNLQQFNISNNNFSGPIPDVKGRFSADSFSGNPGLCGELVSRPCPPSTRKSGDSSAKHFAMYSGYAAVGLIAMLFIAFKLVSKMKPKQDTIAVEANTSRLSNKTSSTSNESKITENKSEYSISSVESGAALSSLIVLTSSTVQGLRFEDLLRAPAELLGKGKHGSLYKVMLDNGATTLAVKRIREWNITSEELKRRMQRLDQARHPNVLAPVAFYCSRQEKLLVYEYQPNGSLFRLLHGSESGQAFEWESRLNVAAIVAEALAFMHGELGEDGIAHGNLKSTNILFNQNMDPGISEYGLMVFQHQSFDLQSDNISNNAYGSFKADIYGFGVILLELLTRKPVQANGIDLARWVHSVVTEEWTVEVFDKALISQGASEERMLNLLQIALKCINLNPYERPNMNQVALMINTLKDEEDRSSSDP
ncbi:hypothetical protein F3Y22_tig00015426pilonHSYRG00160 [Hibiscus syriacus]|uniref:Protein kinase domain-containing protein n=1 Tax=Hibiscus syriacus TaxID=106335 RepID=A0A6A3C3M4_HIBSY|nr:probable inactive receptor kinase At2g26730 [Hibiscus syriacus]KAE8721689.1 hypothetical protein F3Y22_tig00015426pilonHSYRG00160 [Hibiscus syriacus]